MQTNKSSSMKYFFSLFLVMVITTAQAQNRIYFKSKKLSDLNLNIGDMYGVEEFRPTFPLIWKNFDSNSEEFTFSGHYTLDAKSTVDDRILNGEVKLIRYQLQVAEGTMNIKEELVFNFKNGEMNGLIKYDSYYADYNGETSEADLNKVIWKKDRSITANYNYAEARYKNINYNELIEWERTKIMITQGSGLDISLDYFQILTRLNTAAPNEKPIFKKMPY